MEDQELKPTSYPLDRSLPVSFCRHNQALQDHRRASRNAADVTGQTQQIARPASEADPDAFFFIDGDGGWWQVTERIEPDPAKQATLGFNSPEASE